KRSVESRTILRSVLALVAWTWSIGSGCDAFECAACARPCEAPMVRTARMSIEWWMTAVNPASIFVLVVKFVSPYWKMVFTSESGFGAENSQELGLARMLPRPVLRYTLAARSRMMEQNRRNFMTSALTAAPLFVPRSAWGANDRLSFGLIGAGG